MKKLKNKTILITGGAGFIGSNLCEYLLKIGAKVRCLDNLSTGNKKNISGFINNKNFNFINGDMRNIKTCQLACEKVDFVLHQAALGSVPRSIKDPISTNEVNISGFLNMLIASKDNNVKRFIYAASSSTYGDSKSLPKVENIIGKPLSPYAITKYVNELYSEVFKKTYNLNFIGLRYFNVFGQRQDPNSAYSAVIPKFINLLLNHQSPTINGDGSFSRDYTYIDNVIEMNILALTTDNKKALNQIYNTAVGERNTLIDLINILKKYLTNYDSEISRINPVFGSIREGDVPHSLACIKKAKKLLNYYPTNDFESGIEKTISWYVKNFKNN